MRWIAEKVLDAATGFVVPMFLRDIVIKLIIFLSAAIIGVFSVKYYEARILRTRHDEIMARVDAALRMKEASIRNSIESEHKSAMLAYEAKMREAERRADWAETVNRENAPDVAKLSSAKECWSATVIKNKYYRSVRQ